MRELTEPLQPRQGNKRYPWRDIAASPNGCELIRGEDYTVTDAAISAMAISWATRRGLKAISSKTGDGVAIRFVAPEDHPNADIVANGGHL